MASTLESLWKSSPGSTAPQLAIVLNASVKLCFLSQGLERNVGNQHLSLLQESSTAVTRGSPCFSHGICRLVGLTTRYLLLKLSCFLPIRSSSSSPFYPRTTMWQTCAKVYIKGSSILSIWSSNWIRIGLIHSIHNEIGDHGYSNDGVDVLSLGGRCQVAGSGCHRGRHLQRPGLGQQHWPVCHHQGQGGLPEAPRHGQQERGQVKPTTHPNGLIISHNVTCSHNVPHQWSPTDCPIACLHDVPLVVPNMWLRWSTLFRVNNL